MPERHFIETSRCFVWLVGPGSERCFLQGAYVSRISWDGSADLEQPWLDKPPRLALPPMGADLELRYADCGRPDDYERTRLLLRIRNCRAVQTWIGDPVLGDRSSRGWALTVRCQLQGKPVELTGDESILTVALDVLHELQEKVEEKLDERKRD